MKMPAPVENAERELVRKTSLGRRVAFAVVFGVLATAVSFYLMLFLGLMARLGSGSVRAATAPALEAGLRQIALPVSIGFGLIVVAVTIANRR